MKAPSRESSEAWGGRVGPGRDMPRRWRALPRLWALPGGAGGRQGWGRAPSGVGAATVGRSGQEGDGWALPGLRGQKPPAGAGRRTGRGGGGETTRRDSPWRRLPSAAAAAPTAPGRTGRARSREAGGLPTEVPSRPHRAAPQPGASARTSAPRRVTRRAGSASKSLRPGNCSGCAETEAARCPPGSNLGTRERRGPLRAASAREALRRAHAFPGRLPARGTPPAGRSGRALPPRERARQKVGVVQGLGTDLPPTRLPGAVPPKVPIRLGAAFAVRPPLGPRWPRAGGWRPRCACCLDPGQVGLRKA